MSSTVRRLRSALSPLSSVGLSFRRSTSTVSFLARYTRLVCSPVMRSTALSPPETASSSMSSGTGLSSFSTRMGTVSRKSRMAWCWSSVTRLRTSRRASASPTDAPAATEDSMPRSPPVLGTTTLFTFFIRLPLTATRRKAGVRPKVWRTLAAAQASATGSVQPMAGWSSSSRIRT